MPGRFQVEQLAYKSQGWGAKLLLNRIASPALLLAALVAAPALFAQSAQPVPVTTPEVAPIAIVSLNSKTPEASPTVTGALEVSRDKALIAVSGTVTSGTGTTEVLLPHRGALRVCASTTVKLAADSSVPAGETPGLMMALDHGALEMSFAAGFGNGRNADILLTPDFRILIGAAGASEVKVRLGPHGDTCVDNNAGGGGQAPYVLVSSVFDGGDYRVQPGQRVMFEHGSLREVVDDEKELCGCPPPAPQGNEFPLAQSEGLAPLAKPAPSAANQNSTPPPSVEPLVYKSAEPAPQPAAVAAPAASAAATPPATPATARKKPGLMARIGGFFRRIFGAE
jgi:hypothetical protein